MKKLRGTVVSEEERLNSVCVECGKYINVGERFISEFNGGEKRRHYICYDKVITRREGCDALKPTRLFGRTFTD